MPDYLVFTTLAFFLLSACAGQGHSSEPDQSGPAAFAWGDYAWTLGTDKMQVRLTRLAEGDNRAIRAEFQVTHNGSCLRFDERIDDAAPAQADNLHKDWVIISPKSPPSACQPSSPVPPTRVETKEYFKVIGAEHSRLQLENGYEVFAPQIERHPRLDFKINMGTRSLLVVNATDKGFESVLGAIYDMNETSFSAMVLSPVWLKDRGSEESFHPISGESHRLGLIIRDDVDGDLSRKRSRLHCLYAYPLRQQQNEDAKKGIFTTDVVRDRILANALDRLTTPSEDCK